jgi:hypothetical protein
MRRPSSKWGRRIARRFRKQLALNPPGKARPPRAPVPDAVMALGERRAATGFLSRSTASPFSQPPAPTGRSNPP